MDDEALIKKIMPHNMEAEQSVIGSVLLDNDMMEPAADLLTGEDFYAAQYGLIFDAMLELYNARKPIDMVTLSAKLKEKGAPEEMQSAEFLKEILNAVPTSANIKAYAQIVYEMSTLRRLIKASQNTSDECYLQKDELEMIMNNAEKRIYDIVQSRNTRDFEPISQTVIKALNRIQEVANVKGNITGLASGFKDLDSYTAGFQPSDYIIIGARPSMGKTAFVLSIAANVVLKQNKAVAIFSLEMSRESLVNRLFAIDAWIDAQDIRTGSLSDDDWEKLSESAERIGNSKLIIDDTPGITISELRSKARKYKMDHNIEMIAIDYIQLMSSGRKVENRQQEIAEISRAIKGIARELNIPILVLSQLNRASQDRMGHKPAMSDIRESGAIEQDADVIMFLHREDYYNQETERKNVTDVIIAKQRNGPTGEIHLTWQPKFTRFADSLDEKKDLAYAQFMP